MAIALDQLSFWMHSPTCQPIGESPDHFDALSQLAMTAHLQGPAIHDARIAAICLQHGVSELWTADRDFLKFPALKARNPLVA